LNYLHPDDLPDLDVAFEASEVQEMLATGFCDIEKNAVSGALIITGFTLDGTPITSVLLPSTGVDQLVKKNKLPKK
jgi:hypothetical protein